MELENLMKSLSLHVPEERPTSLFTVYAVHLGEDITDIVLGEFINKHMIIVTQYGKVASLLKVSIDQVSNGVVVEEPVYSVNVVFGTDNDEQRATARFLAEKLNIRKPLLLYLSLKNYTPTTIKGLLEALQNPPKGDPNPPKTASKPPTEKVE